MIDILTLIILLALPVWVILSYYIWKKYDAKFYINYFLLSLLSTGVFFWEILPKNALHFSKQIRVIGNYVVFTVSIVILILFLLFNFIEWENKNHRK